MREPMYFNHIAAILRLGKKYEVDHFRDEGLRRLRCDFPSTLNGWDGKYHHLEDECQIRDIRNFYPEIISLAHELGVETILPSAYLNLVQTQSVVRYNHWCIDYEANVHLPQEDILRANLEKQATKSGAKETIRVGLPQTAVHACLIGRDKLLCRTQKTFLRWFHTRDVLPGAECATGSQCRAQRTKVLASLEGMTDFNSIKAMDEKYIRSDFSICEHCESSIENALEKNRQEIWNALPSMFGLPNWEDLKDFDE